MKNGYRVFSNYAEIKRERFTFNLICLPLIFCEKGESVGGPAGGAGGWGRWEGDEGGDKGGEN